MYPMIINIEQKFKMQLLKGYPNLSIRFDTKDFLKGAALDQMNFVTAGVASGILTPNEAREYLNISKIDGGDELLGADPTKISQTNVPVTGKPVAKIDPIPGSSPQDTGGGGGNQKSKMNIGK
jgi:hypothetical protein